MKTLSIVLTALLFLSVATVVQARPSVVTAPAVTLLDDILQQAATKSQQRGFAPQSTSSALMWAGDGNWEDADTLGLVVADSDGSYVIYQYEKNVNGRFRDTGYYMQGVINGHAMTGVYSDPSGTPLDSIKGGYIDTSAIGDWYFTWKNTGVFMWGNCLPLANA